MFCRPSSHRYINRVFSSNLRPSYSSKAKGPSENSTVDPEEVAKFAAQAANWWHPHGSAAPLHRLNPVRLSYIRSAIEKHVRPQWPPVATSRPFKPLTGFDVVDVGCGGGLVTEPLTRLGANVRGIDMSAASIDIARKHAWNDPELRGHPQLHYEKRAAEDLVQAGDTFDAVLALEIIEHVPDPAVFLEQVARLVRPGGVLVVSTINRTALSYALAIVAVEHVVRWLPPGTHDWSRFVRPQEVATMLAQRTSLKTKHVVGVALNPLSAQFSLVDNTSVNYMLTAVHPLPPLLPDSAPPPSSTQSDQQLTKTTKTDETSTVTHRS